MMKNCEFLHCVFLGGLQLFQLGLVIFNGANRFRRFELAKRKAFANGSTEESNVDIPPKIIKPPE